MKQCFCFPVHIFHLLDLECTVLAPSILKCPWSAGLERGHDLMSMQRSVRDSKTQVNPAIKPNDALFPSNMFSFGILQQNAQERNWGFERKWGRGIFQLRTVGKGKEISFIKRYPLPHSSFLFPMLIYSPRNSKCIDKSRTLFFSVPRKKGRKHIRKPDYCL